MKIIDGFYFLFYTLNELKKYSSYCSRPGIFEGTMIYYYLTSRTSI